MRVHLVNPSDSSFGIGVITPRWLYVLAAATPAKYGDPIITDETLEQLDMNNVQPGDIVGIGIHTGNALRGMQVGRNCREQGATVVYGGIHATLYPDEALELGAAHAVVKGDGDIVWGQGPRRHASTTARNRSMTAAASPVSNSFPRVGIWPPRQVHVGIGADGARLPEALLVLLGVADRRPGAAAARSRRSSSTRSSSCGASASASSRSPTTISIRSRSTDLKLARAARDTTRVAGAEGAFAHERFDADGDGSRSCPTTWFSSRRSPWKPAEDPEFLDRDDARPKSTARSSASSR